MPFSSHGCPCVQVRPWGKFWMFAEPPCILKLSLPLPSFCTVRKRSISLKGLWGLVGALCKEPLSSGSAQLLAKGQESWLDSCPELHQPCRHFPDVATNCPCVPHKGQAGPVLERQWGWGCGERKGRGRQGKGSGPATGHSDMTGGQAPCPCLGLKLFS